MRRASVVLVFLAAATSGCGPGLAGKARFEFTSPGSGPSNEAPLDPLRQGSVLATNYFVDGTVDLPAGRAVRLHSFNSAFMSYWIRDEAGLFLAYDSIDGILDRPILRVPSTVRDGMAWSVYLDDGNTPSYTYAVRLAPERDTVFGGQRVWTITETSPGGRKAERHYTEGFGQAEVSMLLPHLPDPAPGDYPRLALEPLALDGASNLIEAQVYGPRSVSLVHVPGYRAVLSFDDASVSDSGGLNTAHCILIDGTTATTQTPTSGVPVLRTGPEVCPTTPACDSSHYCNERSMGHATGAFIQADEQIAWLPRSVGQVINAGSYVVGPDPVGRNSGEQAFFWLEGNDPNNPRGVFGAYTPDGAGDLAITGLNYYLGQQPIDASAMRDQMVGIGQQVLSVWPISTRPGDRSTFLLEGKDRSLWVIRIANGKMSAPVLVGRVPGAISAQTNGEGTELLVVAGDGRVDRIHLEGDRLELEPIGWVELEKPQMLVGAFRVDDHLVVVTHVDGVYSGGVAEGVRLYRTKQTVTIGAPKPRGAGYGLTSLPAGGVRDAVICRPPDGEQPTLSGWVADGATSTQAIATRGGSCVLLLNGPSTDSVVTSFKGTLPGVGDLDVAVNALGTDGFGPRSNSAEPFAALAGGGFISPRWRAGPGGVVDGTPDYLLDAVPVYASAWEDAAGGGLWMAIPKFFENTSAKIGLYLVRLGATATLELSVDDTSQFTGLVEGRSYNGGLLVSKVPYGGGTKTWVRVGSDGSRTALPTLAPGETYCAELADGTLCGIDASQNYFCTPNGGTRRTGAALPRGQGGVLDCSRLQIATDGSLIGGEPAGAYRFDTATMTYTTLASHELAFGRSSKDGTIYAWDWQNKSAPKLSIVTAAGLQPVAIPAGIKDLCADYPAPTVREMHVDGSVAIVKCVDFPATYWRVPLQ